MITSSVLSQIEAFQVSVAISTNSVSVQHEAQLPSVSILHMDWVYLWQMQRKMHLKSDKLDRVWEKRKEKS